ncbi:hypothetical protein D9619_006225 [Psilocybe cf. subviscida]|uniref:DUF6533 domain-containing protein n=1 Tax=Psilocybe cf. subviscida TaxID=2480587 RepID=A0A8H5EY44_9AGAR|nr:hypothetical protein D9619_006225 [Psilocybe cf. subviscida]
MSFQPVSVGNGPSPVPGALDIAGSIETLSLIQAVRYSVVAVMCVLVYEWLANLEDERRLIHCAPWSSVKLSYLLCRYYPLCYWVVALWAYCLNHKPRHCKAVLKPIHALLAPFQFFAQAVLFLRAYAFSGRKRWVLAILTVGYLLVIAADTYLFFVAVPVPRLSKFGLILRGTGGSGCFPDYSTKAMGRRIGFAILASTLLDLSSLTIVLWFCFKSHTGETSLARFFLRQGLTAFAWVGAVNIVSTLVYFRARSSASGIGLPFSLIISNIIVCRLILSLRRHTWQNDQLAKGALTTLFWSTIGRGRSLSQSPSVDIWAVPTPPCSNASMGLEASADLDVAEVPPPQRRRRSTTSRLCGQYRTFPHHAPEDPHRIEVEQRTV